VQACTAYKPCERLVTPQVGQPPQTNTAGEAFRDSLDVIAEKVANACDLPPSPADIDDTWVTGCHSVCASRLCCHIDAKLSSNCLASVGTKECDAYGACKILVNENTGKEMDAKTIENKLVSGDIKALCNIGVVQDSILYDECEDRCTERSCCFEVEEAYSCYGMEKDWCDEFESCKFVDFTFPTLSKGSSDSNWSSTPNSFVDNPASNDDAYVMKSLRTRCTPSLIRENWEMCEDLCMDFECCFRNADWCVISYEFEDRCDKDEVYICHEFFNTDIGKNEKTTNTNVGTTTKNNDVDLEVDTFIAKLEAACSENSLKTLEGIKQCHDKCQTHLCCFTSDPALTGVGGCENAHVQACTAYKPCERLVTPQVGQPPQTNTAGEAFRDSLDVIAEKVANACDLPPSPADIDDTWVTGCHSVCASRLCCHIDAKLSSNCLASVGTKECDAYGACKILVNENTGKEMDAKTIENKLVSGDIKALCNIGVVQDSILYDECEDRCTERSCCFEVEEAYSCYGMEKDWCDEFESCKFVDFTFPTLSKGSSDSNWSSTPNSFVDNPASNDDAYVMKSLRTRCTPSLIRENWEMCEDLCMDFECCFRNADWCVISYEFEDRCDKDEVYICHEFFNTDEDGLYDNSPGEGSGLTGNNDSTSKSNSNSATQPNFDEFEASMEDACSPTALTTLKGIETCYDKCQAHLCCVPADAQEKEFDCSDIYPDECNSVSSYICNKWRSGCLFCCP